jgi:serine/threonine protein kinase
MNATFEHHPTAEQLAAFDSGCLPPADREAVERHVADCSDCCRRLEALPEDALAALVRAYTSGSSGPGGNGDSSSWDIPEELIGHPRYRVLGLIGRGGMGVVYKAIQQRLDRVVALKVLSPSLVSRPDFDRRFGQEAKAIARLSHPNIVQAYEADQVGELRFLVMEYVDGVSLDRLVQQRGPLPVEEACDLVRQAALGLEHAHERGLVHRDVKPANLLLTATGQVKIVDFGLAHLPWAETSVTSSVIVGTPDYLAPEQARNARRGDVRNDVYSLGCTLYHLLAGRPVFPFGTALQKLIAHQESPPPPIGAVRPDVPQALADLLERLLAKDPARRPASAAAVARELAGEAPPLMGPRRRARRWLSGVVLLGAVLAAASVAVWLSQSSEPTPEPPSERIQQEKPAPRIESVAAPKSEVLSAEEFTRLKREGNERAFGWLRDNNPWGDDLQFLASLRKAVRQSFDKRDGFWTLIGARLMKSGKPTLLASRWGKVYHFELTPPRPGFFLKATSARLVQFRSGEEAMRRDPPVTLSDLQVDDADELPLGKRMHGTVTYHRKGPSIEKPALQMVYHPSGKRTKLIFYPKKPLTESSGVIAFNFAEMTAKQTPANQPVVVFVELVSHRGTEETVESNTLAEVLWPAAR